MEYVHRIKKLRWFFLCLLGMLLTASGYRMLWQGEALGRRRFVDQAIIHQVQDLAAAGLMTPDGDEVRIDTSGMRQRLANPAIRRFILERRRFLSFQEGSLQIDPTGFSVANRRVMLARVRTDRGRILDRKGRILARSVTRAPDEVEREYPLGKAGFPLLGVAHPVYGCKGLEKALSPYLAGTIREGYWRKAYRLLSGSKGAYDVRLTLDAELQKAAYQALQGRNGAVAVLEIRTGAILTAASCPSFDPAAPVGPVWDAAADRGHKGPFINRALQRRYPPGSTFKLVTATAWMEQPDFDPAWGVQCRGRHPAYDIREYKSTSHGWVSLGTALRLSCNVFFAEAGPRLGSALAECAQGFGFNQCFSIAGEESARSVLLPSRAFQGQPGVRSGQGWKPIDFKQNPKLVAQGAIGQNVVAATPLQMAMVGAALGNKGVLMAPRLIRSVEFGKGGTDTRGDWIRFRTFKPRVEGRVCSKKTAAALLEMMSTVMDTGTGYRLKKIYRSAAEYKAGIRLPAGQDNLVLGKTGTAESAKGRAGHSWFVAVAPKDHPRYAAAVIVEEAGSGSRVAGPVAIQVMTRALNLKE